MFNVGVVHEAMAAAMPEREALVVGRHRFTWGEVASRSRRLASYLHGRGLGAHTERSALAPWESGQDHLGVYCYNGPEYLEAMLGAFKARVAPFNVNYRYVPEELHYLLTDSRPRALVYHSSLAPTVAQVLEVLPGPPVEVLLQVEDRSGQALLPGAVWYEDALAAAPDELPPVEPSPDDLYILYTGGTTGLPKGVLWRQGDAFTECFGGPRHAATLADVLAQATSGQRALLLPPFMHGSGQWVSFVLWHTGATLVTHPKAGSLDPAEVWSLVERESISYLAVVGDAFVVPLVDELARHRYDLSSLSVVLTGGAPLSCRSKEGLLAHLPTVLIVDGLGASEAGGQLTHVSTAAGVTTGIFPPSMGNEVLSADLTHALERGDDEIGWLAKSGRLALGYLGDPERTARTYPTIDGTRYAVPGDRARVRTDGQIEVHGRDSMTINSGGEKVFAEEVEAALMAHHDVYDCVVAGRPSRRWGQEVIAVVRLRAGATATADDLVAEASQHVARFKLPKAVVFVDEVVRTPAGKADYRWARQLVASR